MSTTSDPTTLLREQLAKFLTWREAHADLHQAIEKLPAELRGTRPPGLAHSPWELLEHIRFTQRDILDFCRATNYVEPKWPDDYWPTSPTPASDAAWDESIAKYDEDVKAMAALTLDGSIDLFAKVPHGTGQTYIREVLLVADHTSHHVAQIIDARRLLGAWPPA